MGQGPEGLDYSLPDEVDAQVRSCLPELFDGTHSSVLYVGANRLRQHFLGAFAEGYPRVAVLEIDPENARHVREKYARPNVEVICGDVRRARDLVGGRFDVCFFYHGPEHLGRGEAAGVLSMLESMAGSLVVLGMPYGRYEQGPEYGNVHESHLWDIYPEDVRRLGYEAHTIGEPDDTHSNMIAWKRTGGRPAGASGG